MDEVGPSQLVRGDVRHGQHPQLLTHLLPATCQRVPGPSADLLGQDAEGRSRYLLSAGYKCSRPILMVSASENEN